MVKSESQSVRNWIFSGLFHRQQYLPTSSIMLLPWHCAAPKFVLLPPKNVLSLMLSFLHWIWLVSDISLLIEWLPKSFIGILLKGFNIKPLLNNNWFSRVHRWWQNLYNLTVCKVLLTESTYEHLSLYCLHMERKLCTFNSELRIYGFTARLKWNGDKQKLYLMCTWPVIPIFSTDWQPDSEMNSIGSKLLQNCKY